MTTTIRTTHISASDLVRAMAGTSPGDPRRTDLRAGAIEAWLPLAHRLAGRYAAGRDELEDLRQTAAIGLIKAVDGFDPRRGADFVAYAVPTIVGELKRYFRDRCWSIRPPRGLHDLYLRSRESQSRLAQRLGRRPTVVEVAEDLGESVEKVLDGLACGHVRTTLSLSAPATDTDIELGEMLPAAENEFRTVEAQLDLSGALSDLAEREQQIIALYYYGNRSQAEIGRLLGMSQMHVSRLARRALATLRSRMTPALPAETTPSS
jgi:RNA polymerase sigma-B factor